jgi:predicted O-methyltransferase YrrM
MNYRRSEHIDVFNKINYENLHSEMSAEERLFISGIISETRPKNLIEVGVSSGAGSVNILNAIADMPESRLISIDVSHKCRDDDALSVGYEAEALFSDSEQWELLTGKDVSEQLLVLGTKFDFAVIDTMHFNPVENLNFLCLLPYLNDGAIVCLHDISNMYSSDSYSPLGVQTATRLLISSVASRKIFPQKKDNYLISNAESVHNIAAFCITPELRENIENVFLALAVPWEFYPIDYIVSVRKLLANHYAPELLAHFDESERAQFAYLFTKGKSCSLNRLKSNLKNLALDNVVFYGAGINMKMILRAFELCEIDFRSAIWDMDSENIRNIRGKPVSYPNYDTLAANGDVMVITIKNEHVASTVAQQFETLGYAIFLYKDGNIRLY